jgi:hypothetical protein
MELPVFHRSLWDAPLSHDPGRGGGGVLALSYYYLHCV